MRVDFNSTKIPFASQLKVLNDNGKPDTFNEKMIRRDLEYYYNDSEADIFVKELKKFQEEIKDDGDPEFFVWLQPYLANVFGVVGAHRGIAIGEPDEVHIEAYPVGGIKRRLTEAYEALREWA